MNALYNDFDDLYFDEEKKFNLISLISDLSGVWSIWAGFSILSFFKAGFICANILLNFLKMTTRILNQIQKKTRSFYQKKKKREKDY